MFTCFITVGPASPPPLWVASVTNTTAMLQWRHVPCTEKNVLFYTILVIKESEIERSKSSWRKSVFGSRNMHLVTGLIPGTTYKVQISALNLSKVPGPWSDPVTFRTKNANVSESGHFFFVHLHIVIYPIFRCCGILYMLCRCSSCPLIP